MSRSGKIFRDNYDKDSCNHMKLRLTFFAFILATALLSSLRSAQGSATVTVPGSGNPWLSGQPDGVSASGDTAPAQSPVPRPRGGWFFHHL